MQSSKIAKSIAETLEESITKKGDATFVVSGGNSPLEIFHCLSNMPIRWSKIKIILGDDRLLDSSNIDSNEKLIAENLKESHNALGEILRPMSSDDLLGEIFSEFCIGK